MATPLVPDALWEIIEPLLPRERPKPKGGRPSVPNRACLTGFIFVLKSGIPWEMLPQEMGCGSGVTCWRRLRDWSRAGVWERLQQELLNRLRDADRIDWSRAAMDASTVPVKRGAKTVPNPTDRAQPRMKRHLFTDRQGIPLAELITAANVNQTTVLERPLDAIPPVLGRRGRHRWVVERTFAWTNQMRRLTIRHERRAYIYHSF